MTDRPVLGFVGIHAGRRKTQPVSQNETLAALFAGEGWRVRRSSAIRRPLWRTVHQAVSILSWSRVEVLVVAVFSGRSFWIADMATFLGRVTGKRLVLFLHGGNLPAFGPAHHRRVARTLDRADLVVAPSDFLAGTFRSWGIDVRIIPNVLAIEGSDQQPRAAARPRLLWMRTFHEHYHPEMAVRVLHRILDRHPDARLSMAGADHGSLDRTRALAGELGVADRVDFLGYLDRDGKRAAFADHDLFLNTNRLDNMPVSLLEAAAAGLVPVATAVGGIPSIVADGVEGRLVPSEDVDAMAGAVTDLLADPRQYAELSRGARRRAEQSGWPAVRERWVDELDLLVPQLDPA